MRDQEQGASESTSQASKALVSNGFLLLLVRHLLLLAWHLLLIATKGFAHCALELRPRDSILNKCQPCSNWLKIQ